MKTCGSCQYFDVGGQCLFPFYTIISVVSQPETGPVRAELGGDCFGWKSTQLKTCTECKDEKSFDQFYDHPLAKDGKQSKCIPCYKRLYCSSGRRDTANATFVAPEGARVPKNQELTPKKPSFIRAYRHIPSRRKNP